MDDQVLLPHPGGLGHHALEYARAGLLVFPLTSDKVPFPGSGGMHDGTTDLDVVAAWWQKHPEALIGCRVPPDVLIIDIDPKNNGRETWEALKKEYGDPPHTRGHFSGRNDGGGHLWFKRPAGKLSSAGLRRWAREHGTGQAVGKHSWSSGIDLLHHGHRYTILPPSPHPATGQPYRWGPGRGLEVAPADPPKWLADLVTEEPVLVPARLPRALRVVEADSIADWFSASTTFTDLLAPEGWRVVQGDGSSDGSKWRHPNATSPWSATVKHGCLFVYSPNTDFEVTEDGEPHGYTPFHAYAVLAHGGDQQAAARAARVLKDGERLNGASRDFSWVALTSGAGAQAEPAPAPVEEPEPVAWLDRPVLEPEALHGLAGKVVEALAPHTEADPVGLLLTSLVYFGASVGPGPHFRLSGGTHPPRIFPLLIGDSARARKGAADSMVGWVFHYADPAIAGERKMTGLNSGEGLIRAVRDPRMGPPDKEGRPTVIEEGVDDKRLLLVEPEFSGRLLPAAQRRGSTISGILRDAWDKGRLQTMTQNPMKATGAHVCVIGHTTADELVSVLTPADITGGFMNRFLFTFVASSSRLPFGGDISEDEVRGLGLRLRTALETARRRGQMVFGPSSRAMWPPVYEELMDDISEGPLGHLTARGPVHVQRLALIYALLDGSESIEEEHLRAGIAVWRYCRATAAMVVAQEPVGRLTGTPDGDRMLALLVDSGRPWGTRELKAALGWNGSRVLATRGRLVRMGLIEVGMVKGTGGRPRTIVQALQ